VNDFTTASNVAFPSTFISISDQVEMHGRFRPRDIAFIEGEHSVDWAGYNRTGDRIAQALVGAGIQKGERVALLASNSLWAHELLLGIWRAGAVAVPLSPLLNPDGLATMLVDSDARMLLASSSYGELAATAAGRSNLPVITEGERYDSFIEPAASAPTGIGLSAEDRAVIIYSSGTTGTPKGIVHSHGARLNFATVVGSELRVNSSSVVLSVIPMHSNGSWLGWLPAMQLGATTVILPAFTPENFVDAVKQHRPTHGFTVPTVCAV